MSVDSGRWFGLVLLLLASWLTWRLAPVITPFAISAGLAYLGDPLVDRLERLKFVRWPVTRTAAVLMVFALMTAAIGLLLLIILPLLTEQVRQLVERTPAMVEWLLGTALPWVQQKVGLEAIEFDPKSLAEAAKAYWKEAGSAMVGVLGTVSRGGQAVFSWVLNLVLIPVVTFYLLRDWDRVTSGVLELLPRSMEPTVRTIAGEVDEVLGAFIRGQLIVMLALGAIYAIGLWLVGIDLAFIIGAGAGLLSIVPYLGTMVGLAAALIAAVFQFQDVLHPVLVLAVFAVGQSLEGMVLTPILVGDRIGLHPVTVIFAVLAGGQLFGFLGILLALPAAAAINVMVRHIRAHYHQSNLYTRKAQEAGED